MCICIVSVQMCGDLHSIRLVETKGKIGTIVTRLVREFMGNLIVDRPFAKKNRSFLRVQAHRTKCINGMVAKVSLVISSFRLLMA